MIEPLCTVFEIGVEHSNSFKYISLQLHQNTDSTRINQVFKGQGKKKSMLGTPLWGGTYQPPMLSVLYLQVGGTSQWPLVKVG